MIFQKNDNSYLDYLYLVRGFLSLEDQSPTREEYANNRKDLDLLVNDMVSKGYMVMIIPTSMISDYKQLGNNLVNLI